MTYLPVILMMTVGLTVGGAILILSTLLGRGVSNLRKDQAFECGMDPFGSAHHQFSVRFYLVAILFLLFDVETIFFYPWAVVFRKFVSVNSFILMEMGLFTFTLLVGYLYVWRRGALEWE